MNSGNIIRQSVTNIISEFLQTAGETGVTNLYAMVIEEVDRGAIVRMMKAA
jgi:DNA-binding protein Fis